MNARRRLGPVFADEWIALSRRWQWYAMRTLFAGMLLIALFVVFFKFGVPRGGATFRDLAKLGSCLFRRNSDGLVILGNTVLTSATGQ